MRDVIQFDEGDSLHIGEQGVLAIRLKGSEQLRPIALASSVRWVQHRFAQDPDGVFFQSEHLAEWLGLVRDYLDTTLQ